jgi:hypothetical protein
MTSAVQCPNVAGRNEGCARCVSTRNHGSGGDAAVGTRSRQTGLVITGPKCAKGPKRKGRRRQCSTGGRGVPKRTPEPGRARQSQAGRRQAGELSEPGLGRTPPTDRRSVVAPGRANQCGHWQRVATPTQWPATCYIGRVGDLEPARPSPCRWLRAWRTPGPPVCDGAALREGRVRCAITPSAWGWHVTWHLNLRHDAAMPRRRDNARTLPHVAPSDLPETRAQALGGERGVGRMRADAGTGAGAGCLVPVRLRGDANSVKIRTLHASHPGSVIGPVGPAAESASSLQLRSRCPGRTTHCVYMADAKRAPPRRR